MTGSIQEPGGRHEIIAGRTRVGPVRPAHRRYASAAAPMNALITEVQSGPCQESADDDNGDHAQDDQRPAPVAGQGSQLITVN